MSYEKAKPTKAVIPRAMWHALQRSGAMSLPHSGRTLFDHLIGTYRQLQAWGQPEAVCLAGLFHSIYGTNAFAVAKPPHRAELRSLISESAEELVWLFANIDRPTAILLGLKQESSEPIPLAMRKDRSAQLPAFLSASTAQVTALAEIECANLIEQGHWGNALRSFFCMATDRGTHLSESTMASLRAGWARQLQIQESA